MKHLKTTYRLLNFCLIAIAMAIVTTGCEQDTEEERSGSGLIEPSISVDATVYTTSGPVTSGIISAIPDPQNISLRISSADGRYSSEWPSLSEYPLREPYRPGHYRVEAFYGSKTGEGFDTPFFFGETATEVVSGQTSYVNVSCRLANTILRTQFTAAFSEYFSNASAMLHSEGGEFLSFTPEEKRLAYLMPGNVSLIIKGTTPEGQDCEFLATTIEGAKAQHLYSITLDIRQQQPTAPQLIVSFDETISTDDIVIDLTPEFLASKAPVITPVGFTSGTTVSIPEGDTPSEKMAFELSGNKPSSLILTTKAQSLTSAGWPAETDLTKTDHATLSVMRQLGLKLSGSGTSISEIDITDAISRLRATDSEASFSLIATNSDGKLNGPARMDINVTPVDISVVNISSALLGVNIAEMTIIAHADNISDNLKIQSLTGTHTSWTDVEILSIQPVDGKPEEWTVRFRIPDVATPTVDIRVLYCNEEKSRKTIDFVSPEFKIEVDAFAQIAIVKILPEHPEMLDIITSLAKIYVNSQQTVYQTRHKEKGLIILGGLNEHSSYAINATLYDKPTAENQFTPTVYIETERMLTVPNGGFEDVKKGIKYSNLPSGGRYSQNLVDIFNQQNYASYDQYVPKNWANVNAKTFCTAAKNKNTWYMQPSAYSISECMEGAYAVCLQTVAWDIDGPAIPDYRQTSMPYVRYSRNIPDISHRAAGKVFLGEYGFDPATGEEVYIEGVAFTSRPLSINGYYKFLPSIDNQAECGLVDIEILGDLAGAEIVIAKATQQLAPATGYTAFSIPLTYSNFGVKATKLKIMISSSATIGTVATESAGIITYSNPETSTSVGGILWIDDLTFSY